jgi:hypothetical protein
MFPGLIVLFGLSLIGLFLLSLHAEHGPSVQED